MSIKNDNNTMNLLTHGTAPTPPPKPDPKREPEPDWEWEPNCDPPEPEAPGQDRKPGAEQPHGLTGANRALSPWRGLVFLNMPFGARAQQVWLLKIYRRLGGVRHDG